MHHALPPTVPGVDASRRPISGDDAPERAAATGKPAASAVYPLSLGDRAERGFRLLSPLYRPGSGPGRQGDAMDQVAGFSIIVVRARTLFESISESRAPAAAHSVSMAVYEGHAALPATLLYRSPDAPGAGPRAGASCWFGCEPASIARTYDWAGQRWHVVITERQQTLLATHAGSLKLLIAGLIVSIAAALYMREQQGQASRMRRLVEQRTAQLRSLNTILMRDIEARKGLTDELERSRRELRELAEHNARVKENERKRIAREIHDDLGQSMLALRIDLAMLSRNDPNQSTRIGIDRALAQIDTTMGAMRMIINELRPAVLDLGLDAAVEWEVAKFHRRTGIECRLDIDEQAPRLSDEISTALYRIVQESMTNIMRHAQATQVEVALWSENGWVFLTLSDNGVGMTEQCRRKTKSFGLIGIAERIYALGGAFDNESREGKGTTLTIAVPVAPLVALGAG